MKKRLAEEAVLFLSVLKWFGLATFIGAVVGLSTTIFLKVLHWSTAFTHQFSYYFLLIPVAFFASVIITKYLAPEAQGHGTEKVIESIHKNSGRIKLLVAPVKLVTSVITLTFGGSAGKEGPCAQIGGGLASAFADLFKFDDVDRRKLVICGISAGFAAVFGTPIAGAIFGVEVLFVGKILYDVMLPSFIAGITSYQITRLLGITYFSHKLAFIPGFSEGLFIKVIICGFFFGICSLVFIEVLKLGNKLFKSMKIWPPLKGAIGGAAIVLLSFVLSKDYLGLGLETIQASFEGGNIAWYAFLAKILFTSITLNSGGSGGIITPILFVGAAAGNFLGGVLGLDRATTSAIGLVALLAGATNTPIASSIIAIELFGPEIAPFATTACVISFLMTGHRSVYPSQILGFRKSSSIDAELGKEIENTKSNIKLREKSLTGVLFRTYQRIMEKAKGVKK